MFQVFYIPDTQYNVKIEKTSVDKLMFSLDDLDFSALVPMLRTTCDWRSSTSSRVFIVHIFIRQP